MIVLAVACTLVALSALHAMAVAWQVRAAFAQERTSVAAVQDRVDALTDRSLPADAGGFVLGVALGGGALVRLRRRPADEVPEVPAARPRDPSRFLVSEVPDRVRPMVRARDAA